MGIMKTVSTYHGVSKIVHHHCMVTPDTLCHGNGVQAITADLLLTGVCSSSLLVGNIAVVMEAV